MTDDDERESQYVAELEAGLPEDERNQLALGYGQYLVDRQQRDLPARRRDFVLGWIACVDTHCLRPKQIVVQISRDAAERPTAPAARPMVYQPDEMRPNTRTIQVRISPNE